VPGLRRSCAVKFRNSAGPLPAAALFAACVAFVSRPQALTLERTEQQSGTNEQLIAVSAVTRNVVWVSGLHGTFAVTTNGGATWKAGHVSGAEDLEFRDVHGVSNRTAYLLSVGPGKQAKIFKTDDGGATWMTKFTNIDAALHWKCLSFWNPLHGVAVSDPLDGGFIMMSTVDGGWKWDRVPPLSLPAAVPDERVSAESGTCVVAGRSGRAWIGTTKLHVLRSTNYGASWKRAYVPITKTDSTGIVALAFRDKTDGMALGQVATSPNDTLVAFTDDGGATWTTRALQPLMTEISGGAFVPGVGGPTVLVVGPHGATYSRDGGETWERIDTLAYHGVAFSGRAAGWAVGLSGRITKFAFR
jgi:photosystem II stability/assembly factor-like uncharacterized protein